MVSVKTEINHEGMMPLVILRTYSVADGIRSFELARQDLLLLPPFTAGAHVKVQTPNGALRKYSLCNSPIERDRYVITVKRDSSGQGGSVSLVDGARQGDLLYTSLPVNSFRLVESAASHIFIAGGIGITPIISMIRSMSEGSTAPWKLYYLTRKPETTAFLPELSEPNLQSKVIIHHNSGDPTQHFDLWPILERSTGAHLYCCGPQRLMEGVRDMTGHWPSTNVHFESFRDGGRACIDDRPFTVKLARSGRSLLVPVGKTILETLRDAGLKHPSSCESGTCGTCRTRLVSGEADHRDMVLLPEERAEQVMICVSRAESTELILDL